MYILCAVGVYSCAQAALSTFLSVVVAACLLPWVHALSGGAQRLVLGMMVLMSMVSTTLVALCVQQVYGSGMGAIIITHVLINAPFALYMLYTTYEQIDGVLLDVARDLGATHWHIYTTIIVPCMRSALIASASIIFVLCFSSFSPIKILATQMNHHTLTMCIAKAYKDGDSYALWLATVLRMLMIFPCVVLPSLVARRVSAHISCPINHAPRRVYAKPAAVLVLGAVMLCVQRIVGFPMQEISDVVQLVCGVSWPQIIKNTLVVAILSSIGSVIIGSALCFGMWRSERALTRRIYSMVAMLPMLLGGIASAFCCKMLCATMPGVMIIILSQIFLHYPFAFRMINAQMSMYSDEWRLHAYSMGASWWQWMRTIWAPFFARSISRGLVLTFGLSLSDAGLMSVLSDNSESTLAMIVHQMRDAGWAAQAIALSICTQLFFLVMTLFF